MTERILITQPIDASAMALLEAAGLSIDVWPGPAPMPAAELRSRARGCAGLISMLTDPVDAELMAAGPLRVIAQHAVGVNNIDLEAAKSMGVAVAHTPGVLTEATADLAMALLLSAARRIVEGHALVSSGEWQGWSPTLLCGMELNGSTMGVVGMGRIGAAVARRAEAFGMRIIHHNRSSGCSLEELLAESDVVSLHCPLTPDTHHLIDEAALEAMKDTAILINTARGPVVDEAALVQALSTGGIAAAGLDVFEEEPRIHPGLMGLPNVVMAPHLGSATVATRRKMGHMVAEDLIRGLREEPLEHAVRR
tara:strand:+ start:921 stop:1847 length:927 start_codon:yes stop_codon:yes gene_type:complete